MIFLILGPVFLALGIYFLVAGGILKVISYTFLPLGIVFTLMGVMFRGAGKRKTRLLTTGVDGTATVVDAQQTSMMVNNQPVVALTLEVSVPGHSPFTATTRATIPIMILSQVKLVAGATLPVKADQMKPQDFVIDWNAAVQQQAAPAASSAF